MTIHELNIKIAQKAGKFILRESKKDFKIEEKGAKDLVTEVDLAAEELIISEIKKHFPDHGILAEESEHLEKSDLKSLFQSEYIWIIDPIDGTKNFAHGLNHYCTSIGVFKTSQKSASKNYQYLSGELVSGAIFAPALNELFTAEKGKGAKLNGKKIQVSSVKKLNQALATWGYPPNKFKENAPYFQAMATRISGTRQHAAAALDLANVAAGRTDAFWVSGIKPWDIAAGTLILAEAGGIATDLNGQALDLFGGEILATNSHLHPAIVKTFSCL